MNWLPKFDSVAQMARDMAGTYWEVGAALALVMAAMAIILAMRDPEQAIALKAKARVLRYCHSCPFCDLHTETCSVDAQCDEKCGLIDKTAGMSFTVTKNT